MVTTADRRSASHACRSILLLNASLDSDHDILSLDPAMATVKAAPHCWRPSLRPIGGMTGRHDPGLVRGCSSKGAVLRMAPRSAGKASHVVIALGGSNVHIFARPHRRGELTQCFETVLGSPVRTVEYPGIDLPML